MSVRVLFARCDAGRVSLPYQLRMLPFPPRALAKEYLGINPGYGALFINGAPRHDRICRDLPVLTSLTPQSTWALRG